MVWDMPGLRVNLVSHTAWGSTIGRSVLSWLRLLRWPTQDAEHEHQELGVTWLELVTSWMLYAKLWIPVKRTLGPEDERLIAFQDVDSVRAYDVKFSELAHSMSKLVLQILTLHFPLSLPPIDRAQAKSLYLLGAGYWQAGFRWRPEMPHQDEVVRILEQNVTQQQGRNFDKIPSGLVFSTDLDTFRMVQHEIDTPWSKATARCHAAARQVKDMVKQRQPQIAF